MNKGMPDSHTLMRWVWVLALPGLGLMLAAGAAPFGSLGAAFAMTFGVVLLAAGLGVYGASHGWTRSADAVPLPVPHWAPAQVSLLHRRALVRLRARAR